MRKNPSYTALLRPTRLLIFKKSATYTIKRSYTIIWQVRVLINRSCHIQIVEIGVKYWNFHQNLNLHFLLIFSRKKPVTEFCILGHLQAIKVHKIKLQSSIKGICASFRSDFFSAENLKKKNIPSLTTISTLRIWHEPDIRIAD